MLFEFVFLLAPDDVHLRLSVTLRVVVVLHSRQPMILIEMGDCLHETGESEYQIHQTYFHISSVCFQWLLRQWFYGS